MQKDFIIIWWWYSAAKREDSMKNVMKLSKNWKFFWKLTKHANMWDAKPYTSHLDSFQTFKRDLFIIINNCQPWLYHIKHLFWNCHWVCLLAYINEIKCSQKWYKVEQWCSNFRSQTYLERIFHQVFLIMKFKQSDLKFIEKSISMSRWSKIYTIIELVQLRNHVSNLDEVNNTLTQSNIYVFIELLQTLNI